MPEVIKGYSLNHAYKFYKKKHKEKWDTHEVPKEIYRDICCDFNEFIVQEALKGRFIKLPHSMGNIWCKKFKINWEKPPVDLNASKKEGKVIYHLNIHSDGWCVKWAWTKRNSMMTNLIYYGFTPTRTNSERLSAIMKQKDGHKQFFS